MPLIGPGSITQVTLDGRLFGQRTLTVLHYMMEPFSDEMELELFYTGFNASMFGMNNDFEDKYLACCSNNFSLTRILTQVIFPIRYYARQLIQAGKDGTVSSISLPPGVSASLTKRSILSTPHSIGGVRMPAVPTSFQASGELNATGITAYGLFCDQLNQAVGASETTGLIPIIFRRTAPALSEQIAFAFPQSTLRTMSRRVVRRGE